MQLRKSRTAITNQLQDCWGMILSKDWQKPSYSDMQKVEDLRTQLPASFITTYEYIPYIGISKIRDPKNVSTYFKYDDSGRLIKKTDHKGELISSYKYSNNL